LNSRKAAQSRRSACTSILTWAHWTCLDCQAQAQTYRPRSGAWPSAAVGAFGSRSLVSSFL